MNNSASSSHETRNKHCKEDEVFSLPIIMYVHATGIFQLLNSVELPLFVENVSLNCVASTHSFMFAKGCLTLAWLFAPLPQEAADQKF